MNWMNWMTGMLVMMTEGEEGYLARAVSKTMNEHGIVISTADTHDEGFETALLDGDFWSPVERYDTKEEARQGHQKWVEKARVGMEYTRLYWSGGPEENCVLRMSEKNDIGVMPAEGND